MVDGAVMRYYIARLWKVPKCWGWRCFKFLYVCVLTGSSGMEAYFEIENKRDILNTTHFEIRLLVRLLSLSSKAGPREGGTKGTSYPVGGPETYKPEHTLLVLAKLLKTFSESPMKTFFESTYSYRGLGDFFCTPGKILSEALFEGIGMEGNGFHATITV